MTPSVTSEPGLSVPQGRQARQIFLVLSVAYLASQFYRVSNAVIAPELMRELALSPATMGVITSVFFLVFAAAQIPTGILLDRVGPRKTMAGLLSIAVAGSAVFALSEHATTLILGRVLMGLGCAAGLMGSMVVIARWFPPSRFAQLSSWLFIIGGIGFLLATTPLALVTEIIGWRGAFLIMAAITLLLALALFIVVRDRPAGAPELASERESFPEILRGLGAVLRNKPLRLLCAMQFVSYATVLTVLGLWAGPYLNDVHGLDVANRGYVLLGLNICSLLGVMGFSQLELRLNTRKWSILAGTATTAIILLVLATLNGLSLMTASLLLVVFSFCSANIMLIHAHARALLPDHLVGRGMTLQNLAVFLGIFALQSLSGHLIGQFPETGTGRPEVAYQAVFAFLAAVNVVAGLIYMRIGDVRPRPG